MTKEQREAYRPAFEAWVDGELQILCSDGWKDWPEDGRKSAPSFLAEPNEYRRKPKPRVFYMRLDKDVCCGATVRAFSTEDDVARIGGNPIWRCEEVME